MLIKELAQRSGVPAKTIRFYESVGLLPNPQRANNNYRQYAAESVERLRFIASARNLGLSLAQVGELLSARDRDALPCRRLVDSFRLRIAEVDRQVADLLALRSTLEQVCQNADALASDKPCDEHCECYLIPANLPIRKDLSNV